MKKGMILCLVFCILLFTACGGDKPEPTVSSNALPSASQIESIQEEIEMLLTSAGIVDGVIDDQYGARSSQQDNEMPTRSLPLTIENAPEGTVCYALRMLDPDSAPLCGFEWVHWTALNIELAEIPENASIDLASSMIQGKSDFGVTGYGGPTPPDKPHTYVITVYALDATIEAENGFEKGEFEELIAGHILAEAQITGIYSN